MAVLDPEVLFKNRLIKLLDDMTVVRLLLKSKGTYPELQDWLESCEDIIKRMYANN